MKRMISMATLALAIVLGATAAQAWEFKPYAGVGMGSFDISLDQGGVHSSGSSLATYGIFGADFNDYLGAEVRAGGTGLLWLFRPSSNFDIGFYISLLGKLQVPVTEHLRAYALAGITSANLWTSGLTGYRTGLSFGGGANYAFNDHYSLSAEWMRYWSHVSLSPSTDATFDGLSMALDYHF